MEVKKEHIELSISNHRMIFFSCPHLLLDHGKVTTQPNNDDNTCTSTLAQVLTKAEAVQEEEIQ